MEKRIKKHSANMLRKLAAGGMSLLTAGLLLTGCGNGEPETQTEATYASFEETVTGLPITVKGEDGNEAPLQLNVWYFDEAAGPYYEAAAAEFHDRYGVEVVCIKKDEVNYLEDINKANQSGSGPDVLIASNDEIRKLHLAGLVQENTLYTEEFWKSHYPEVTRNANRSDEKQYGYPIYMDTCLMIYDSTITTKPESFGSITDFAVNFVDETNTKTIFKWDIADPFCDYLFLGKNAQILGTCGEDTDTFEINNESVVQNMTYYQSLHEYFSMDADSSSYDSIKSALKDGTLVYGIVKTDVLGELSSYGTTYALCPVPDLSAELGVQNLSVTYSAFVNPFTKASEYANLFSAFLSYEYAGNQFGISRKVAVRSDIDRSDANDALAYEQYCNTVPLPKALENGDFWIYSEICFKNIWNGNDVATELNALQEKMDVRLK